MPVEDFSHERDRRYGERFEAQEKAVEAALASTEKAIDKAEQIVRLTIDKAEANAERRYLTIEKEFHEHLEQARQEAASALQASNTQIRAALVASETAITKAEIATEKRFESVNEFRGQLNDQANLFYPRSEAEAAIGRNVERIQELTDRINKSEGRGAGLNAGWGYVVGAVGLAVAIVTLLRFAQL